MYKILTIANIKLSIDTSNEVGEMIFNDLNSYENNRVEDEKVDITISFKNKLNFDYKIRSGEKFLFDKNSYLVKFLPEMDYKLSNYFIKEQTLLDIKLSKRSLWTKIREIFYGKNVIAKDTILSYSVFWYIFQLKLMLYKKTFLHAGIFCDEYNNAIAFTGTGGSGKTSVLFNILENIKYKYLAEDFGIIDNKGFTYFNSKPISIYDTDMTFNPDILGKVYNEFNLSKQILWNLQKYFLKKNPMIKLNPYKVLGKEKVSKKAKLKKIFYLIRKTDVSNIEIQNITKEELAYRSMQVAFREFRSLYEILTLLNANSLYENILNFDKFKQELNNLYIESFSHTDNYLLILPMKITPLEIIEFLKNKGLL